MVNQTVRKWINDKTWAVLGPVLHAAKQSKAGRHSTQSDRDLMESLIWEARTGSPWRDMPAALGKWHNVYMRFRRWEARGGWKRFWAGLSIEALAEATIVFIDSTTVRAHQHAAGAPKKTRKIRHWADHAEA
jgi:transposase